MVTKKAQSLLKNKIIRFYNSERCHNDANICGPNRTKLKNGDYFPPPYPYVGDNYESPNLEGKELPKIFFLSINQNLSGEENVSEKEARWSLYPKDVKNLGSHWYGPLDLCVSLANIAFSLVLGNIRKIDNEEIMKNIAYSNCVRCANTEAIRRAPTPKMREQCEKFTKFEIETLMPELIFCIGRDPFRQIKKIYNRKVEDLIEDFVFRIEEKDKEIKVIYFYHYGNQESINAGRKLINLFAEFNDDAKKVIEDVDRKVTKYKTHGIWREDSYVYNDFAKYYSVKIIENSVGANRIN